MAVETFEELVKGLCAVLGAPVPKLSDDPAEPQGLNFEVSNVPIVVAYAPEVRDDRVFVFCRFGPVPESHERAALRRLLEVNFILFRGNAPVFSIDPTNGEVVFGYEGLLSLLTPETVVESMERIAEQALKWRDTLYLDEDNPMPIGVGDVVRPGLSDFA